MRAIIALIFGLPLAVGIYKLLQIADALNFGASIRDVSLQASPKAMLNSQIVEAQSRVEQSFLDPVRSANAPPKNFTKLALELALLDPMEGFVKLESEDVFEVLGVKTVEEFACDSEFSARQRPARKNILDNKDNIIIYQHISKAGGTSFCGVVRQQLKDATGEAWIDRNCDAPFIGDDEKIADMQRKHKDNWANVAKREGMKRMRLKSKPKLKNQRGAKEFIAASRKQHLRIYANEFDPFPTGIDKEPNVVLATMLREPNSLLVSWYKFFFLVHEYKRAKEAGNTWKTPEDIPKNSTLEGWMLAPFKNNFRGQVHGIRYHQENSGGYCRIFNGGNSCQVTDKAVQLERFTRALYNLEQHCLVMVLELMPLIPSALRETFGWTASFPRMMSSEGGMGELYKLVNHKSSNPRNYMLEPDILSAHYLDTILYYWAKRRMLERVSGCIAPGQDVCPK